MKRVEALKLMAEGWELGVVTSPYGASVTLQKGGQMRGGKTLTVSWTVYEAMRKRGEIVESGKPKFWITLYKLSRADRTGDRHG